MPGARRWRLRQRLTIGDAVEVPSPLAVKPDTMTVIEPESGVAGAARARFE
jgi:hypothetical protein